MQSAGRPILRQPGAKAEGPFRIGLSRLIRIAGMAVVGAFSPGSPRLPQEPNRVERGPSMMNAPTARLRADKGRSSIGSLLADSAQS